MIPLSLELLPLAAKSEGATHAVGPIETALVSVLVVVGTFFLIVGTVGLLRLPNVYNRMHATSKATTLGAASIALAGFVFYGPGGDGLMSLVTVVFLFLTAPTGAHMISRAAQRMGIDFLSEVTWPAGPDTGGEDTDVTPTDD
ncbi:monovalent cation/H(+) antiporter subunit G [Halogeometricum borinquense]|uniref:Monovalent cation/H(+) antiporter subunit G n=1 Tax=Halogeometricum borinquense TaxID=60847 RepID=A0A482TAK1_9EURY|nr:monovalent cation/H(+) antiporter subunit G [Halogeometricum borinquense]RYJ13246.1 monovalent cation/H(+) antiporter subunit G [Halogeometricum borinquense]